MGKILTLDSQLIKLSSQISRNHTGTDTQMHREEARDSRKITILDIPFNISLRSILLLTLREPSVAWWWAVSVARCSKKVYMCKCVHEDVDGLSALCLRGMKRASVRGEKSQETLAPMGSPNATAACALDSFAGSPHAHCQPMCTHGCT